MRAHRTSSSKFWPLSNSNAACSGPCATRSITPTWTPKKYRPALSCRAADFSVICDEHRSLLLVDLPHDRPPQLLFAADELVRLRRRVVARVGPESMEFVLHFL